YPQEGQNQFDFPTDFDFAHQNNYKIKGTVLSSDPIPQAPEPTAPTVEERLSTAESAVLALMGGVAHV
ncbi:MAG: hypothetical protein RR989_04745, partial [Ruthenibacterium sp.]